MCASLEPQGVRVISTPVNHYRTNGPVALRIEWKGLAITYSGRRALPHLFIARCCPGSVGFPTVL